MENSTVNISLKNLVNASAYTDNPSLFMQMVLGNYSEPKTFESAVIKNKECTFMNYNPLSGNVNYSYIEFKYYNKDKSDYKFSPSEDYFIAEFYRLSTDYISLLTWNYYGQLHKDMLELAE